MNKDNLVILSNEKIYDNSGYFCDNIDIKNLSEKLNYHFNVYLIGRKSNQKRFIWWTIFARSCTIPSLGQDHISGTTLH